MRFPFSFQAMLLALLLTAGCAQESEHTAHHPPNAAPDDRQAEVAARGAEVMPFDLERTLHVFEPVDDGGIQQVVARDSADYEQIELIRAHLREEAMRFAQGDFSDPARIHGEDMPGLKELSAGAPHLSIRYTEIPAGAQIRYAAADPALVDAVHRWFAAQRSDHGRHAHPH